MFYVKMIKELMLNSYLKLIKLRQKINNKEIKNFRKIKRSKEEEINQHKQYNSNKEAK